MAQFASALARRFEGRLFTEEGRLYFVLSVDLESGMARVSCRSDTGPQVIEMSLSDVGMRLATSANLQLDGLSRPAPSNRVAERSDGWYFSTREGHKGPFASEQDANDALQSHVLAAQSDARSDGGLAAAG